MEVSMHRVKWISIMVVIFLSLTFLFPAQKTEDRDNEQTKKIIKKACKDDYVIDLSGLEELKNLKISIDFDELFKSLENLKCLEELKDLDCHLEGLEALESLESLKCLEALKVLDKLHIDIDFDDFDFDFDDHFDEDDDEDSKKDREREKNSKTKKAK